MRNGILRLRRKHEAPHCPEFFFTLEGDLDLGKSKGDTYCPGKSMQRNFHAGKIVRDCMPTRLVCTSIVISVVAISIFFSRYQLPAHNCGIGKDVAQKSESRHGDGITEPIWPGDNIDYGYGKHVPTLGAFDEEGAGEGMNEVQVRRSNSGRGRVEVERIIEGVAGFEDGDVTITRYSGWLDGRVPSVVAGAEVFLRALHGDNPCSGDVETNGFGFG